MTKTDITPTKLVINCVNRDQWNQAKIENRIEDDEVWVVSPDEQLSGFNKRVVEVLDPVESTDAATKNYVDSKIGIVEAAIQTKQPIGDYLTPSTTLADLQNTPGFQTSEEVDQKIAAAPFQPIGDYVTTDNDYVTESDVSRVVDQAKIRRIWNENLDGYTDSDGNIWHWSGDGSTYVDKFARLTDLGNVKELFSDDEQQKILGNREVFQKNTTVGHWTDWQYSDGQTHSLQLINDGEHWLYHADGQPYKCSQLFNTEEEAQNASELTITVIETSTYTFTASRQWVEATETWNKIGDLALKSDIIQSGISEDEARTLIQSYDYVTNNELDNKGFRTQEQVETQIISKGYQTQTQVESQITSKGYRTQEQVESQITSKGYVTQTQVETQITSKGYVTQTQVESQITSKGYRTEQQVDSQIEAKGYVTTTQAQQIAADTLPTGYAQTEVIGTREDGTEVHFYILTKEI